MCESSPAIGPSTTASIDLWLQTLPLSPPSHRAPTATKLERTRTRTRNLDTSRPRKRVALGMLGDGDVNERQGRAQPTSRSQSPRKRRRGRDAEDEGADHEEDVQDTPRAARTLPPSSLSSTSSNRSQSPTKMAEFSSLQGGEASRILEQLHDVVPGHDLHHLLGLLQRMRAFTRGMGVVDQALQAEILADPMASEHFDGFPMYFDSTPARRDYGESPTLQEAKKMSRETRVCLQRQETEPAWNNRVHYPLLQRALELSGHVDVLNVANITTARIQPLSLLPQWRSGEGLRSKLVDYAITLQPDRILELACTNLEVVEGARRRSLNCTCLHTILDEPIAISIETKTQDGKNDEAHVQLFIWAVAQVQRLLGLAASSATPLSNVAMPLLSVHGALWKAYAISWRKDQGFTLWDLWEIGSTREVLGYYKVFAVLQLLMQWAQTEFRPWVHGIVPLTPDDRAQLRQD